MTGMNAILRAQKGNDKKCFYHCVFNLFHFGPLEIIFEYLKYYLFSTKPTSKGVCLGP
jgi:hypothetical protein